MENNNIINVRVEVPGLELLAQAVMALASQSGGIKAPENTMASAVPAQAVQTTPSVPTVPTVPAQAVQTAPSAQALPTAPVPQVPVAAQPTVTPAQNTGAPIPTTAVPVTHTMDELAVAASQLVNMGKQPRLFEILHGFGVNSLMELPQEKYAAFAGCLKAEGVKF